MNYLVGILTWILALSVSFAAVELKPEHPDPQATPGELCDPQDQDFSKYRYKQRIPYCSRNVSSALKDAIYRYYNIPEKNRRHYTVDHFIPLSIGGNNSPKNLWPEHRKIKELRIDLETQVYEAVRDGRMTQEQAIQVVIDAKMNPPIPKSEEYVLYKQ